MASTIITKNSSTTGSVPLAANLTQGELAVNVADRRLYTKDATGTVVELGGLNGSIVYRQNFSGNGSTTTFTLTNPPLFENFVDVYISGVYQSKDVFSISGSSLIFSTAPAVGTNNIEVLIRQSAPIGVTSANYVTYTPSGTIASTNVQDAITELSSEVPKLAQANTFTQAQSMPSLTLSTTALTVANGGTGAATLAANNVLLGNGTSALQAVAPGTSGNVLSSNGTTWTSVSSTQGMAKAWVNFNGTGTVAILQSLNVSSITDVGTGAYTVNFSTSMTDANFCAVLSTNFGGSSGWCEVGNTRTASSVSVFTSTHISFTGDGRTGTDYSSINVAVFR